VSGCKSHNSTLAFIHHPWPLLWQLGMLLAGGPCLTQHVHTIFMPADIPTVTAVSPTSMSTAGGTLTITGTGLAVTTGSSTTVKVGTAACTSASGSPTSITCTLASGLTAGTPTVVVTVGPAVSTSSVTLEIVGQ